MTYTFKPLTEEQLNSFSIVEKGIYDFEVLTATKKMSKSGYTMAELYIKFWDNDGKVHFVYDYLIFSDVPLNIKKVKHFCEAVGFSKEYEKGEIPENLSRLCGKALLDIQEERPNPNGGVYPKRNVISDYIYSKNIENAEENFTDSDLPF